MQKTSDPTADILIDVVVGLIPGNKIIAQVQKILLSHNTIPLHSFLPPGLGKAAGSGFMKSGREHQLLLSAYDLLQQYTVAPSSSKHAAQSASLDTTMRGTKP